MSLVCRKLYSNMLTYCSGKENDHFCLTILVIFELKNFDAHLLEFI